MNNSKRIHPNDFIAYKNLQVSLIELIEKIGLSNQKISEEIKAIDPNLKFSKSTINNLRVIPPEKSDYTFSKYQERVIELMAHLRIINEKHESSKILFWSKQWELYFFYENPENNQSMLGLANLSFKEKQNGTYDGFIQNFLVGKRSANYKGLVNKKDSSKISNFIILNLEGIAPNQHIHIKLRIPDLRQNIVLGHFMSIQDETVTSGTLVLYYQKDVKPRQPQAMNFKSDTFPEVPQPIRTYLSKKKLNYLKLAKKKSLEELETFVKNPKEYDPSRNFFEDRNLHLYIATPYTQHKKKTTFYDDKKFGIEKVIERLKKKHNNNMEIFFRKHKGIENKREDFFTEAVTQLYKTSIFVLIYLSNVPSSALIELGVALRSAKRVIVFLGKDQRNKLPFLEEAPNDQIKIYEIPESGSAFIQSLHEYLSREINSYLAQYQHKNESNEEGEKQY